MNTTDFVVQSTETPRSISLSSRYGNAYAASRAITGFGTLIKVAAVIMALLFLIVGIVELPAQLLFVAVVFAAAMGGWYFFMGVFVSAQGETLQAIVDTAVNTSPFLDNDQKARVMSLPMPSGLDIAGASHPCPVCKSTVTEIYERTREGEGWVCRACSHTWTKSQQALE